MSILTSFKRLLYLKNTNVPGLKQHVIGVSVSEPHTSELNGRISYIYVNMYILNSSRRALKPSQDKENRLLRTRERESPTCGRNGRAKAEKISEVERDRAR